MVAALVNAKAGGVPIITILNQQTTNPAPHPNKHAGSYAEV